MKFRPTDLVRVLSEYHPIASNGDYGTVQFVDKYGNIAVLLEDGEFAGRLVDLKEDVLQLVSRLDDEELDLLKEEL